MGGDAGLSTTITVGEGGGGLGAGGGVASVGDGLGATDTACVDEGDTSSGRSAKRAQAKVVKVTRTSDEPHVIRVNSQPRVLGVG